jgi:hypothetical protein
MYRIEPESAPFDVAPIIGDVFAKRDLPNGRYSFRVLAMDSSGQVKLLYFCSEINLSDE